MRPQTIRAVLVGLFSFVIMAASPQAAPWHRSIDPAFVGPVLVANTVAAPTVAGGEVDCLSPPTIAPPASLGGQVFTLISCFEELELRLNAFMQDSISSPPFDKFDRALIALHSRATVQVVKYLRSTIMTVLTQGTDADRLQLAAVDDYVSASLIVDEAKIIIEFMRSGGGEGPTGSPPDPLTKPKELEMEIKDFLSSLKDKLKAGIPLGPNVPGLGTPTFKLDDKQLEVFKVIDSVLTMLLGAVRF